MTATVEALLPGRSLATAEGSIGFCGTYLVTASWPAPRRIIFDPGHAGRRAALASRLAERGLGVADIDVVVLSHAHWDHAQNVDMFPRATVLAHASELEDSADGSDHPRDAVTPAWTSTILKEAATSATADGEVLAEGVTVVHLPGHTRGSIGLRVETASGVAVLSGDAVSRRDLAQEGRCANPVLEEDGRRSTLTALDLADEIWPGHDRPFAVVDGQVGAYLFPAVPLEIRNHAEGDRIIERCTASKRATSPQRKESEMNISTADLWDERGTELSSLALSFESFSAHTVFSGRVRTVRCHQDNVLMESVLAQPGDGGVLVVDGGGSIATSLLGDRIAEIAVKNGWAGIVINGAVRDRKALASLPLGLRALGSNPRKSGKTGTGDTDVEVEIGGAVIRPGVMLFADEDGIVVEK
jgi:regulator of ribonuclease activity A